MYRNNNPGLRKYVYCISNWTIPKGKNVFASKLADIFSIPYRGCMTYCLGRRNFLRLVLQDPSWCRCILDCKDVFPTLIVSHIPFLGSHPPQKRFTMQGGFVGPWLRRSRGNGWWRTQLKYVKCMKVWGRPPFRGGFNVIFGSRIWGYFFLDQKGTKRSSLIQGLGSTVPMEPMRPGDPVVWEVGGCSQNRLRYAEWVPSIYELYTVQNHWK